MPTALGVIFFLIAAYCFLFQEDGLFGLLIVASTFQASSAVKIGERGIPIFYLIEAVILARAAVNQAFRVRPIRSMPHQKWLLIFALIAVTSAFILPFLFAGIPVYDPLLGIDEGLLVRPPLQFGMTNVTQAAYLIFHILTAYAVLSLPFSWKTTRKAYMFAFYLVVLCVFAQAFCKLSGIPFPDTVVRNNPDIWDLATSPGAARKPGTFLEPSFAGAFLVMYCVGFIAEYLKGRGSPRRVILSLVASGMVTSSGSLLTLLLATLALLVYYSPFRRPWYINTRQVRRILWAVFLLITPVVIAVLASSNFAAVLIEGTLSKSDSGSFFNRTTSDIYALQLLWQTYGIGVGFGSNRSSSLITFLAGDVGIAGLLTFGVFSTRLFAKLPKEFEWFKWGGFGLLLNMCIDVPDVTFPVLWIAMILALAFTEYEGEGYQLSNRASVVAASS